MEKVQSYLTFATFCITDSILVMGDGFKARLIYYLFTLVFHQNKTFLDVIIIVLLEHETIIFS